MSSKDWWALSINHLRDELKKRGLHVYGAKASLIQRLKDYDESYNKRLHGQLAETLAHVRTGGGGGEQRDHLQGAG